MSDPATPLATESSFLSHLVAQSKASTPSERLKCRQQASNQFQELLSVSANSGDADRQFAQLVDFVARSSVNIHEEFAETVFCALHEQVLPSGKYLSSFYIPFVIAGLDDAALIPIHRNSLAHIKVAASIKKALAASAVALNWLHIGSSICSLATLSLTPVPDLMRYAQQVREAIAGSGAEPDLPGTELLVPTVCANVYFLPVTVCSDTPLQLMSGFELTTDIHASLNSLLTESIEPFNDAALVESIPSLLPLHLATRSGLELCCYHETRRNLEVLRCSEDEALVASIHSHPHGAVDVSEVPYSAVVIRTTSGAVIASFNVLCTDDLHPFVFNQLRNFLVSRGIGWFSDDLESLLEYFNTEQGPQTLH